MKEKFKAAIEKCISKKTIIYRYIYYLFYLKIMKNTAIRFKKYRNLKLEKNGKEYSNKYDVVTIGGKENIKID